MPEDAHIRQRLLRRLEELLGLDLASELMASLPPNDWTALATKADVDDLRRVVASDIDHIRRDLATLRDASRRDLSDAVLQLQRSMSDQAASFERALRTELSKQSRAAVAGMVGMTVAVGSFIVAVLALAS
jgi:hypothetical protein